MDNIEIINIAENNIEVIETTPIVGGATSNVSHTSLIGRDDGIQHSIAAIDGLRAELDEIKGPRTIESDKVGVATYYPWADGNPSQENRTGRFVTCQTNYSGQVRISIANSGDDVFGVTVDEAAFIGGQDAGDSRGYKYGLVVTNGFVDVRCDDNVVLEKSVTPGASGIATLGTNVQYGNKAVAFKEIDDDGVKYVKIFLGISSKEAGAMSSYMINNITNHGNRLVSAEGLIEGLLSTTSNLDERVSTDVNITGGTIGGWGISNGFTKTFGEGIAQRTVALAPNASGADSYVLQIKSQNDSLLFGLNKDGIINTTEATIRIADITTASIGTINVKEGGSVAFPAGTGFGIYNNTTGGSFQLLEHSVNQEGGGIISACGLVPSTNGLQGLGDSSHKFKWVYADTFYGNLNGTATQATEADKADKADEATIAGLVSGEKCYMGTDHVWFSHHNGGVYVIKLNTGINRNQVIWVTVFASMASETVVYSDENVSIILWWGSNGGQFTLVDIQNRGYVMTECWEIVRFNSDSEEEIAALSNN